MTKSTWDLFDEMFKVGDDIVLIDDDDEVAVGTLTKITKEGCCVWRHRKFHLRWEDIRFISHDGFPARKLSGADGSKLIEHLDTGETQDLIRQSLIHDVCSKCGKLQDDKGLNRQRWKCDECVREQVAVFGDPFMVEGVSARLWNPGNSGPQFWETPWEECLALKAKDGARAQLYDLATVYFFD